MIRVVEVKSTLFGTLADQIEKVLRDNDVTRENLIDIKFSHDGVSYALVIFDKR